MHINIVNQSCSILSDSLLQKDEVFNEVTDDSFRNAVAVMPLLARSVAAELREASDQVGKLCRLHLLLKQMSNMPAAQMLYSACASVVLLSSP